MFILTELCQSSLESEVWFSELVIKQLMVNCFVRTTTRTIACCAEFC